MLNHLKEWILEGIGKRTTRRRVCVPRFRGQIEQLESRTVLSATIGVVAVNVVAVDFEANTITVVAVWESRPPGPERLATDAFNQFSDAPWETLPPFGSHGYFGEPGHFNGFGGRPDHQFPLGLSNGGYTNGGGAIVDIETGHAGPNNSTDYGQPQFAHADPSADPGAAKGGTSNFAPPSGDMRGPVAFMDHSLRDATGSVASYFSSLSTFTSASETASSATRISLKTYDAVFGDYSPDSLLLAADLDSKQDSDSNGDLDDKLESDDEKLADVGGSEELLVDQDAAASLDALQRERTAIDAVLAQLHDLKLHAENHANQQTETTEGQNSDTARESGENYLPADHHLSAQPAREHAEGGMVLLEPSGDANSSAYDLTAVYLRGLDGSDGLPLVGVEASVGMYQAIDIGANDLRPMSNENAPIAQPAATIRPSVSAENAPAKKSEQPAA